ncbi:ABC transporter substrate-binding protein [Tissierella sp.]|uniref:ABC transporter substrate-binding protein n=1 Tax=Tissierella sp. TaxID=41274 RepID=UPI00285607D8|nr:ABC transporter substrate-binding protein [Tissierella sp.]MDR7855762.1 ABC transporter substrate-binding protein [Tissierella sp.]
MKNKKALLLILVIVLIAGSLAGCKSKENDKPIARIEDNSKEIESISTSTEDMMDEYGIIITDDTVQFTDGRNEEVTINKNPERAVVLFASFANIWVRNGGDMVGMVEPSNEDFIPGTDHVETLGKQGSISLEKVIALEPDLVVLSYNTKSHLDMIPALEENNIPIMVLDYQFKDDYFKISKIFAALNDNMEVYEQDTKVVKEETQRIIDNVPKDKELKVLIIMATKNNINARNSETTIGEMFKDLNTINIADSSNDTLSDKNFSLEKIIEEDPDFIFVQAMGSDMAAIEERLINDVKSNPAWSSLSAVKNDRYILLDKSLYTYKANERYAEAYEELAKILYPEVFK